MRLKHLSRQTSKQVSWFDQGPLQAPQMHFVTAKKQGDDPQDTTCGNDIQ